MNGKIKVMGLLIMFVCTISFPIVNELLGIVKDSENLENRALAEKPEFNVEILDTFPAEYEKFYNDHFTIRSLTVKYYNYFNLLAYKQSPFPSLLIIGYNDWLFLTGNMQCYLGTNRLNDVQLEQWKNHIETQRVYVEQSGAKFYFMISPDKSSIYSENIPYFYYKHNDETVGEQLTKYLKEHSKINVISVFDHLREQKEEGNSYYKLDNHWNQLGGFYAASYACKQMAKDIPNLAPMSLSDFDINTSELADGDISRIIGRPDFYKDNEYELSLKKTGKPIVIDPRNYALPFVRYRNTGDSTKPSAVILGDSFTNLFHPFMSLSFGKCCHVFDGWKYSLAKTEIDSIKPDVYLLMIYEAHLPNVPIN